MKRAAKASTWAPQVQWRNGGLEFDAPRVMGVLNITPDSFSDGGRFLEPEAAVGHAHAMAEAGAAIIDIGAESTRPGAPPVSASEELDRLLPVLERLVDELEVPISVDTCKAEVIAAVTAAGASLINDVYALRSPGALEAAAAAECAVCLMHMQGEPRTMQTAPYYEDVVSEVCDFLEARANVCVDAGIPSDHILIDPGFGFGKTGAHNLSLLRHLPELLDLGYPVLVGLSRKATIGVLSDVKKPEARLAGSLAAASLAVWLGASMVRVHDVAATVEALSIIHATRSLSDSGVRSSRINLSPASY
ncbi:MAG: dihydropteroate synthase [Gammaproteobacteria bacterium]